MLSSSGAGSRLHDERTAREGTAISVCPLSLEPLFEGRAGEGGMRPGQQRSLLEGVAVAIGWVGDAFDSDGVAATGGEQSRHFDEAFLAWTGDLWDRCRAGSCRVGGEVGKRLGDRAGGDQLRAHVWHVTDSVLSAPVEEFRYELVELRSAQDPYRDRSRQHRLFMGSLRGEEARGEAVDADDRDDDDSLHAGLLADLLQVARRCGEERRG